MRRWNGWGDETDKHPLPTGAEAFLEERIGRATRPVDARLKDVVARVPGSRLPEHPLVTTAADDRVRHARGQSFPDWIATRTGQFDAVPDGVAYPVSADDVRALLTYAKDAGARVIPYGGGTSVAGHINADPGPPVLTLDVSRLNQLIDLDAGTRLATFGAGITGPTLEARLRAHGYTLGHYPQSFEYSTLGGWVATRSSGQQSLHYGRIEDLFAGGHVETPTGALTLPPFPASAAGPDLRQMILGSEGRMGVITRATVRIQPQPEFETFRARFFPDFGSGVDAVRAIAQAGLPLSMLRLSTAVETETNLALAGRPGVIGTVERLLRARGIGDEKAMLLYGVTGGARVGKAALREAESIMSAHGGISAGIGRVFGSTWAKGRFRTPYLRNTLWDHGYGVDTVETATTWTDAPAALGAIETAIIDAMRAFDERIHVFTHFSHLYPTGTSIYTSYVFRLANDPARTLERWQAIKEAVSRAIVDHGGTISHQHGVGRDHAPYLHVEKGERGLAALRALAGHFDPDGLMNPGALVSEETDA
jgi:alkyldihydroxyacetonephosphate synthase